MSSKLKWTRVKQAQVRSDSRVYGYSTNMPATIRHALCKDNDPERKAKCIEEALQRRRLLLIADAARKLND